MNILTDEQRKINDLAAYLILPAKNNFQVSTRTNKNEIHKKTLLSQEFQPNAYSVICGRGKVCFGSVGNRRFRVIASTFLEQYSNARSKVDKSMIVSKIVEMIHNATPRGLFVKHENGRWWEVSDHIAREKVGAFLRDCLHTQYRSSAKAKLAKKRAMKAIHRRELTLTYPLSFIMGSEMEDISLFSTETDSNLSLNLCSTKPDVVPSPSKTSADMDDLESIIADDLTC